MPGTGGEHYLIGAAGQPHEWQRRPGGSGRAGRLLGLRSVKVTAEPGSRAGVFRLPLYAEQAKHPLNKKPALASA